MKVKGRAKADTRWVELDGLHVPEVITAVATGPELPFDVEIEAELEGKRMVVRSIRTTRGEITSEALREVPVTRILSNGLVSLVAIMNFAGRNFAAAKAEGPTDSTLKLVATIYRFASLGGEKPTQAVVELLEIPRSTAARWVQQSRRRGFLGPTEERKAGQLRKGRRFSEAARELQGDGPPPSQ